MAAVIQLGKAPVTKEKKSPIKVKGTISEKIAEAAKAEDAKASRQTEKTS